MVLRNGMDGALDQADQSAGGVLPVWLRVVLGVVIVAGLWVRVAYLDTTVFCNDQACACALAEDIAAGHWQTGGLRNSGDFRNLPGFVYLMAAAWRAWADPLSLLYFTAVVNVLAVLLSACLIKRWLGSATAWWATALLAAGPWAIHYSRWIWAQHLLFPSALLVYLFLWLWVGREKKWAVLGVILSLTLLVQIHLAGVVLALAVGMFLLWRRPKLYIQPILIGVAIAVLTVLPYLLDGHLGAPAGNRLGYRHWWRIVPGAAMSVTGLGWSLEFRGGYSAFAQSLGRRRWAYEVVMVLPVFLLGAGILMGLGRLWRERRRGLACRKSPLAMVTAMVVLIPLSFILMGLRVSPTYLPVWYPLPFALMGWAVVRLMRRPGGKGRHAWIAPVLIAVLCVQLGFFAEQLRYIKVHGGVPGSALGQNYAAMKSDIDDLVSRVDAAEIWMLYEGPSRIQAEAIAYLMRNVQWSGREHSRALIRYRWRPRQSPQADDVVQILPDGVEPPPEAFQIRPWPGPRQKEADIPHRPE